MYLAPPSGRAQCMTSHLHIPHSSCFSGQIVQLLSGKLNQHCELVSKRSSVAINTGVVCYEVSDPEPAVKNSWSRQTYSAFRYWCRPKFKCHNVSTPTGQSEMCALCRRGSGCFNATNSWTAMKPHFSKLPQYSLSTVASKDTFWLVGKLYDSILQSNRTYIQYSLQVIWHTLLPTSIISALFSCRIQSCIGYSYSVDCCLCWGRLRMRIRFPQQKERVALTFSTCQRSSPLHFSLTSSLSVMVTCLSLFFALVLTRHFFWCWSCFFLSAMQWLLCVQLSAVTTES